MRGRGHNNWLSLKTFIHHDIQKKECHTLPFITVLL